jgi:hypothetical protein
MQVPIVARGRVVPVSAGGGLERRQQSGGAHHSPAGVVSRKISVGLRSAEGMKTCMALASLFETWQAPGHNSFGECLKLQSQAGAS